MKRGDLVGTLSPQNHRWSLTPLVAMAALSLAVLGGACGTAQQRPLPPPVPTISVVMSDYRFEHQPSSPAGRVVFRIANQGQVEHAPTLARLPDDFTAPVAALFRDETARTFGVTARLFPHAATTTGTFAVDLRRGRYVLVCFLTGPDGVKHLEKGMFSELKVT